MSARGLVAILTLGLCLMAGSASAQVYRPSADTPRRGAVEIGGGLIWAGGFDADSLPARLTTNAGNEAPPTVLFDTETRVGSAPGVQARAGVYLTPRLLIEAGLKVNRPVLSVSISGDFEGASGLTVEQTMTRYLVDGSVLWHLRGGAARGARVTPFVMAGAGYLRELHEGSELVETGRTYHAGAGLKYWMTRRVGLRLDAGVTVRDGGYAGENQRRSHPVVGATLGYRF